MGPFKTLRGLLTGHFNIKASQAPADAEKAISLERAMEIFDQFANRTDLSFGCGCCQATAHVMCRTLMDMGLVTKKAWALDAPYFLTPNGEKKFWSEHVAPVLSVRMPTGNIQDMVFDPALFDGPRFSAGMGWHSAQKTQKSAGRSVRCRAKRARWRFYK